MNYWLVCSPIIVVMAAAIYFIWAVKRREKQNIINDAIVKSGDRGEFKVQSALKVLERPNSKYHIYHNIKLGPDLQHTNEYDTLIVGHNGIFHIETKNFGGERGGIIDIDSNENWILHKKSGYSKMVTNPYSQVDSHEYRLKGFLHRVVGIKNLPMQGIIVLSCDDVSVRSNRKMPQGFPIVNRLELVNYIKHYNSGKTVLYPNTIKKICRKIESMNNLAPTG